MDITLTKSSNKKTTFTPNNLFWTLLIGSVVVGSAGLVTYLVLKPKKDSGVDFDPPGGDSGSSSDPNPPNLPKGDSFPLKRGSKGPRVQRLQLALIAKYGPSILPRFGADSDFGNETQTALQIKGLPTVITESFFNSFVSKNSGSDSGSGSTSTESHKAAGRLAIELYYHALKKNHAGIIQGLKRIKTPTDYVAVSNVFRTNYLRGVRQTLVTGLLGTFPSEALKEPIRKEFLRMGLIYDGSKWSLPPLSGLFGSGRTLTTLRMSEIHDGRGNSLFVPAGTTLGTPIKTYAGYTLFRTIDNHNLIVLSNDVIEQ